MARSNSTNLTVPDASLRQIEASDRRSLALNLLISLRPGQWTKNFAVFAALVFAEKLFDVRALAVSGVTFVIFCALSGVVYLINDIADRHSDREHVPCRLIKGRSAMSWCSTSRVESPWAKATSC